MYRLAGHVVIVPLEKLNARASELPLVTLSRITANMMMQNGCPIFYGSSNDSSSDAQKLLSISLLIKRI